MDQMEVVSYSEPDGCVTSRTEELPQTGTTAAGDYLNEDLSLQRSKPFETLAHIIQIDIKPCSLLQPMNVVLPR